MGVPHTLSHCQDQNVCPSAKTLSKIQRLELWAEGALGKVHLEAGQMGWMWFRRMAWLVWPWWTCGEDRVFLEKNGCGTCRQDNDFHGESPTAINHLTPERVFSLSRQAWCGMGYNGNVTQVSKHGWAENGSFEDGISAYEISICSHISFTEGQWIPRCQLNENLIEYLAL